MMHCGLEIILPDGELLRTGMGALPNPRADPSKPPHEQEPNQSWQLFNYGFGPYNDGSFSQASLGVYIILTQIRDLTTSLGICTKMGIWLMTVSLNYESHLQIVTKTRILAATNPILLRFQRTMTFIKLRKSLGH